MNFKKWNITSADKETAKMLADECEIDPISAYIVAARGYSDPSELDEFLSDEPQFADLYEINDVYKAADIINSAIENDILIAVYGDYDCDGVVATSIFIDYLRSRNARCIYYIPDRINEGYGMNTDAIDVLNSKGVGLIITVDNGISSTYEILYAKSLGINVVVTDHHIPKDMLPEADAVVDPHRADSNSSFKDICGAFVAYKVICAVDGKEPEQMIDRYCDLLSIATIGDVMPLTFENRSIVKRGIEKIISRPSIGVSAILNVAGLNRADVTASRVAFGLVPRINAAGRMGDASRSVELLLCDDMQKALKLANEIDLENALRQKTEKEIFDKACEIIEKNSYQHNRVIVVGGEDWHSGVVGISASRIVEKYGKPAIVLSVVGDVAHGSGRSCDNFSLFNAVNHCSDLLTKFGGHELAAGLSLSKGNIDLFRKKINEYALSIEPAYSQINIDCKLRPSALSVDLAQAIKQLEPFGNSNPVPLFGIFSVIIKNVTPIGSGKHLRLTLQKDDTVFNSLLFGVTPDSFSFECGDTVDIAVNLDTNIYNDNVNLSVIIKAIRVSGTDEDTLFNDIVNYNDYKSEYSYNAHTLLPTRDDVVCVYKYLLSMPANHDKVVNKFLNTLGFAKTSISLDTLSELKLIELKNNIYTANKSVQKTDLMNSAIYKNLTKEGEI